MHFIFKCLHLTGIIYAQVGYCCFGFNGPPGTVFQSVTGRITETGKERREKKTQTIPTRSYCKHSSRPSPRHWQLPSTIARPGHPSTVGHSLVCLLFVLLSVCACRSVQATFKIVLCNILHLNAGYRATNTAVTGETEWLRIFGIVLSLNICFCLIIFDPMARAYCEY